MQTISMDEVVETIESKRTERGISQSELARRVDMNVKSLNNALLGKQGIKADKFVAICHELDLEVDDFVGGEQ